MNPLKTWRQNQKLTQIEAAKVLGLQQCEVSYYERGKILPSARTIARINAAVPDLGTELASAFHRNNSAVRTNPC